MSDTIDVKQGNDTKTDDDKMIVLNVGGIKYTTSLKTLLKYDNTLFSKMVSNNKNGYFIDRDGTYFSYILNFMRMSSLVLTNDDIKILKHLLSEAQYYNILPLSKLIKIKMIDTNILSNNQIESLQYLTDERNNKINDIFNWKLLYKYNINDNNKINDKYTSNALLKYFILSSNIYPILTVIYAGNYIFGFYNYYNKFPIIINIMENKFNMKLKDNDKSFVFHFGLKNKMINEYFNDNLIKCQTSKIMLENGKLSITYNIINKTNKNKDIKSNKKRVLSLLIKNKNFMCSVNQRDMLVSNLECFHVP